MLKDIPITEARHELTSLPERLAAAPGAGTLNLLSELQQENTLG